MKKRILALLLAGLLTASMASCTTKTQGRNDLPAGTEGEQTRDNNNSGNNNGGTPIINETTWQEVNETVYVTASSLTLVGVDNTSITAKVNQMEKLTRIKVGSNNTSIVVKDGVQYTCASKSLNNEDLLGENYDTVSKTTMYANDDKVKIRKYASSDSTFSTVIDSLDLNDTVTVVAKGTKWYKIEYTSGSTTNYYFVTAEGLSETKVVDPNDLTNYPTFDNSGSNKVKMYVIASESLTLRAAPSADSDYMGALSRDDEVWVLDTKSVNGSYWSLIWAPDSLGLNHEYYVNAKYLSENKGGLAEVTLSDMLKEYTSFTELDAPLTLYATDSLNIRSTPELPEDNSNYLGNFQKADAVKVVATGTNDNIFWALVAQDNGEYGFVSYKYLTTNSNGEPAAPTLAQLLASYPNFGESTARQEVYAKDNTIPCLTAPENQDTDVKLDANEKVTVVATGSLKGQIWYVYETAEGDLYFGLSTWFNDNAA